jgi:hypothetical protein
MDLSPTDRPQNPTDTGEEKKEEEQNFCILCGKYTKDPLEKVLIGMFQTMEITAMACPSCVVITSNVKRIFFETMKQIREKIFQAQMEAGEKKEGGDKADTAIGPARIIVPGRQGIPGLSHIIAPGGKVLVFQDPRKKK